MEKSLENLLLKHSRPGGRYAVYPPPKSWKRNFTASEWRGTLKRVCSPEQNVDVYVHIPFCKSLCTFCGCNIKVTSDHGVESSYLNALLREWNFYYDILVNPNVRSLYLGGGTPHFFSPDNLQRLFEDMLHRRTQNFVGTMEVDPREISSEHLEIIRRWGFTRIVLGVQDFNHDVLVNVNREQSFERVLSVVEQARKLGFEEIVTEWIYGLPLQTLGTLRESLERLRRLNPEGVALYPLAKVPGQNARPLAFGNHRLPDIKEKNLLYCMGQEELSKQNFQHIGMGHFFQSHSPTYKAFLKGCLGRNSTGLLVDRTSALIGIGAGSIGKAEGLLWQNEKVVEKYEQRIFKGTEGFVNIHGQSPEERERDNFFERLLCKPKPSVGPPPVNGELFDDLLEDGILEESGAGVGPTRLGRHFFKTIFQVYDPHCPKV